jgi:hypothetical protein
MLSDLVQALRLMPCRDWRPDEDAEAFIWSANGKRRHMTKGQLAMIAAVGVS